MTHRIYFAQHGLALDKADDPERPLSAAGVAQTGAIARILQDSKTPLAHIFHSGKLRAKQTAEVFAGALKTSSPSAIEGLSPNDDVTLLAQNLTLDQALYIGHLPHLEKLVASLLCGDDNATIVRFQNSGVLCLEKEDNQYHIKWLLTPELTGHELSDDTLNP